MTDPVSRRSFTALSTGLVFGSAANLAVADDKPKADLPQPSHGPVEAPFTRDYPPPAFKPSWKRPQVHRLCVQDFVIYAHSDLDMTKKLLEKEPALLNA